MKRKEEAITLTNLSERYQQAHPKKQLTIPPSGVMLRLNKTTTTVNRLNIKTNFVNLTPHDIVVEYNEDGTVDVIHQQVANDQIADLLLEPKPNTVYLVSSQVAEMVRRTDVLSPGIPVRSNLSSPTQQSHVAQNLQLFK